MEGGWEEEESAAVTRQRLFREWGLLMVVDVGDEDGNAMDEDDAEDEGGADAMDVDRREPAAVREGKAESVGRNFVHAWLKNMERRWTRCNSRVDRFMAKETDWLDMEFEPPKKKAVVASKWTPISNCPSLSLSLCRATSS